MNSDSLEVDRQGGRPCTRRRSVLTLRRCCASGVLIHFRGMRAEGPLGWARLIANYDVSQFLAEL